MRLQMEARNAGELQRVSEEESGARRRLREAHARALTRGEISLRRAEETAGDLEKVHAVQKFGYFCLRNACGLGVCWGVH